MAGDGGDLVRGERCGEAMEDGVVYVEDLRWVCELRCVPVIMGRENRRLGVSVYSEKEGLECLIGGLRS